ncbi:hypothetical protein HOO65_010080 [Ceratocystis lukuohia]|uniref:Uncharacterized protein n=1 Tax=Ceratocystis lukuohia TaxID=2019550 RepID=A0ABR4MR18_9PEZI
MNTSTGAADNCDQPIVLQPSEPTVAIAASQHGMTMEDTLVKALEVLDQELPWNSFPGPLHLQGFLKNMVDHGVVEDPIKVSHSPLQFNVFEMLSFEIVFFNRPHWQITPPSTIDVDDGTLQDSSKPSQIKVLEPEGKRCQCPAIVDIETYNEKSSFQFRDLEPSAPFQKKPWLA